MDITMCSVFLLDGLRVSHILLGIWAAVRKSSVQAKLESPIAAQEHWLALIVPVNSQGSKVVPRDLALEPE